MGAAHATSSHLSNGNLTPLETACGQGPLWVRGERDGVLVVKSETDRGLVRGGLPAVRKAEVVFLAAASGPGGLSRLTVHLRDRVGRGS